MTSVCYLIPEAVDTAPSSFAPERLRQIDHSLFAAEEKGDSRSTNFAPLARVTSFYTLLPDPRCKNVNVARMLHGISMTFTIVPLELLI